MTSMRPPRAARNRHADEIAEAVDRATRRLGQAARAKRARQVRGMVLDVAHARLDVARRRG